MVVSSTGYYYSEASSSNPSIQNQNQNQNQNQLQSFESNQAEMYNLATSMEMIGFPPKNNLQQQRQQQQQSETNSALWKGFSSAKPNPSSSMTVDVYDHFNKTDFRGSTTGISDTTSSENLMVAPDQSTAWHDHNRLVVTTTDSSLRSCVFPCEGNERPSQGLSLSLSSTNPSTIGLQSFELRQQDHDIKFMPPSSSRDIGFFGKSMNNIQHPQHQHMVLQDGFLGKAANLHNDLGHFQIRNSNYLGPAQQLLNEFCNLGTKQTHDPLKTKPHKSTTQWQDENAASGSSSKKPSLSTLELLELQKRKTKLLSMLEEVDRRYRHYRDQMKAVVSSFEAVAGNGAAMVYSALASKAMSRHFRCLRDGIVDQIKANKKAMGEKDTAAPGTTRGETPRLRLLDQTLRQHRAFQQMSMMESHPWRPQRGLPERAVSVLRAWLFEHFLHPYPSDVDKHILARQTGLSRSQVSNWFINARVRLWKPMVEEMYVEETKEQDSNMASSSDHHGLITAMVDNCGPKQSPHSTHPDHEDQKLKLSDHQLVRIDSECLSSIINNQEKNDTTKNSSKSPQNQQPHNLQQHHHHHFGSATGTFGAMELDFSSYSHRAYANNENEHHNFGGGGSTLTLGLQQHNGGGNNGVSLAFSPTSQNSLFFNREHIEDCQPVHQYSLLDTEGQNLPYRNLMGAQLLHDLAG